jgi:hypothetical protein
MLTHLKAFGIFGRKAFIGKKLMIRKPPSLISRCNIRLALALALVLLSSIPFVQALEIHHVFAEVDYDGHQHSDDDLCQWVQHHTSNSLVWDASGLSHWSVVAGFLSFDRNETYASLTLPLGNPRGPPVSSFS